MKRWSIGAALVAALAVTPGALPASSKVLFKPGFNLCKAAPLTAVRKTGGQPYRPGAFDGRVCNWERADFKAGITLAVLTGATATAMKPRITGVHGTTTGPGGMKMRRVKPSGGSAAVIETLPVAVKGEFSKELLIAFPQGIAHISVTAPGSLPDSRVLAIGALLTK